MKTFSVLSELSKSGRFIFIMLPKSLEIIITMNNNNSDHEGKAKQVAEL